MRVHSIASKLWGWISKVWNLWWTPLILLLLWLAWMIISPGGSPKPLGVRVTVAVLFLPAVVVFLVINNTIEGVILAGLEWRASRAYRRAWEARDPEAGCPEPSWPELTRTQYILAMWISAVPTLALGYALWRGAKWMNASPWWRQATAEYLQAGRWVGIGVVALVVLGGIVGFLEWLRGILIDATFSTDSPAERRSPTPPPAPSAGSLTSGKTMNLECGFRRLVVALSVVVLALGILFDYLGFWPHTTVEVTLRDGRILMLPLHGRWDGMPTRRSLARDLYVYLSVDKVQAEDIQNSRIALGPEHWWWTDAEFTKIAGVLIALLWVTFFTVRWIARGFTSRGA